MLSRTSLIFFILISCSSLFANSELSNRITYKDKRSNVSIDVDLQTAADLFEAAVFDEKYAEIKFEDDERHSFMSYMRWSYFNTDTNEKVFTKNKIIRDIVLSKTRKRLNINHIYEDVVTSFENNFFKLNDKQSESILLLIDVLSIRNQVLNRQPEPFYSFTSDRLLINAILEINYHFRNQQDAGVALASVIFAVILEHLPQQLPFLKEVTENMAKEEEPFWAQHVGSDDRLANKNIQFRLNFASTLGFAIAASAALVGIDNFHPEWIDSLQLAINQKMENPPPGDLFYLLVATTVGVSANIGENIGKILAKSLIIKRNLHTNIDNPDYRKKDNLFARALGCEGLLKASNE